ncbi:hypothetical protein EMO91_07095 [Bifidobacterium myosotis]|uniref:Uncharacterized protein n=1 Tax=Bifidobacterium myosotis TaxID=1630166 RepID=A0A5M9ZKY6_9BIFI|nr:hypothetical protein EMO91_07095 [Bifidobacterium myosotis]
MNIRTRPPRRAPARPDGRARARAWPRWTSGRPGRRGTRPAAHPARRRAAARRAAASSGRA